MAKKKKKLGEGKTLTELVTAEEHREERAKRGYPQPSARSNFFPFSTPRAGQPNILGLDLKSEDVKILNGILKYGVKPPGEFCKLIRMKSAIFYQRFHVNPDLVTAIKLLALTSSTLSFAPNMATLGTNFSKSAAWAKLYLQVHGLISDPTDFHRVGRETGKGDREPLLLSEEDLEEIF